MNPVARGDLAARLASPRGIRLQTIYLAICSAFLFLSLPPEIGRFDLRDANLLLAVLAVHVVLVTYLASAVGCGELSVEGEKGLPDLALSAFPASVIAAGKAISSAGYAVYLLLVAMPILVLSAALRGAPLAPIAWAGVLTFSVSTAAGIWGAYFAGRFTSDFTRSFVHWGFLASLLGATALLPSEWWMVNPVRTIDTLVRTGWTRWLAASVAGYVLLSVVGMQLVASYVHHARSREESE